MSEEFGFFLQYLLITLDGLTSGIMIEGIRGNLAPGRFSSKCIFRVCCYWIMEIVLMMPDWLLHRRINSGLNMVLQLSGYCLVTKMIYRCTWKKSFEAFCLYLVGGLAGEMTYHLLHPGLLGSQFWPSELMIGTVLQVEILLFFSKMFFMKLYLAFQKDRKLWFLDPVLLAMTVIAVSTFVITPAVLNASTSQQSSTLDVLYPIFVAFSLCVLYLMVTGRAQESGLASRIRKKSEEQNKIRDPEEEARLARLRHDARNISIAVSGLAQDHPDEALKLLESVRSETESSAVQSEAD